MKLSQPRGFWLWLVACCAVLAVGGWSLPIDAEVHGSTTSNSVSSRVVQEAGTARQDQGEDAATGTESDEATATPTDAPAEEESADAEAAGTKFLRIRRDDADEPLAMETAITSYVPADGEPDDLVVDLIGVVHVGDASYYAALNEIFTDYDAVLYELVAPEGTRVDRNAATRGGHPVSRLQHLLKNVLELEFQLEQIDYSPENLIHADMTPQEFAQSMKDRGESFFQLFMRMMMQSMAAQSNRSSSVSDAELLFALFSRDRALRMKRIMAEQFEDLEAQMDMLSGPEGSTLITERNKKALRVLQREMDAGRRRIAIFYGAGHLPDMEDRLIEEFGLERGDQRWLAAWRLTDGPLPADTEVEETGEGEGLSATVPATTDDDGDGS